MGLLNLLRKNCNKTLFTTPSHSQSLFIYHKLRNLYKLDISETEVHDPQAALLNAEKRAAEIYKTVITKFLTNGSTSGILASVMACANRGDEVLIWKNSHPCHKNAVRLAGANPVYYDIETDHDWGVPSRTSPDMIESFLRSHNIKAVIVTSPTYEGYVSDIKSIKEICGKYGAYLIVDEAHGALYPFSDRLPQSAINIADFTVQSLHKTAGGLNPTALLHCNCNLDVEKSLSLISTTSPSYPLLASIEANINYLNSQRGRKALNILIDNISDLKNRCSKIEFGGDDITKILIKVKGLSGYALSDILFDKYKIEDEKTNEISTMLLCGLGTSRAKLYRLKKALLHIVKNC